MEYKGLIAGLGNPGKNYKDTRHNCGFMFIDKLLQMPGLNIKELSGKKFNSFLWQASSGKLEGVWLFAMPLTFMNESGNAVKSLLHWHNLSPAQLVVVQDELDIPAGEIRFKFGGGLAGHNGLASIAQCTGTKDFYRLRIGIGKPLIKEDMLNWVLGKPAPKDKELIQNAIDTAIEDFFIFCKLGDKAAASFAKQTANKKQA